MSVVAATTRSTDTLTLQQSGRATRCQPNRAARAPATPAVRIRICEKLAAGSDADTRFVTVSRLLIRHRRSASNFAANDPSPAGGPMKPFIIGVAGGSGIGKVHRRAERRAGARDRVGRVHRHGRVLPQLRAPAARRAAEDQLGSPGRVRLGAARRPAREPRRGRVDRQAGVRFRDAHAQRSHAWSFRRRTSS